MEMEEAIDYLILPKKFSLKQIVLHQLAKKYWENFILTDSVDLDCLCLPCKTKQLLAHRKTILNILLQNTSCLPKKIKKQLVNAVLFLQQGYNDALIWEDKRMHLFPFIILSRASAGVYEASNFVDPSGHFNDLIWVKRFVADEKQDVKSRFKLACLYCFEETIVELWHSMKKNLQLPCNGILVDIKEVYGDLVGIWAYQLEDKYNELVALDRSFEYGFYVCGLDEAIFQGHEYAARFFWKYCSNDEKARFLLETEQDFRCLLPLAEKNHASLVNFIYSLLSENQRKNMISWTIQNKKSSSIWSCLLHSHYYETVLNDILDFSHSIPAQVFESVLSSLSYKMTELPIPIYEAIFTVLWNHLPQEKQIEVLETEHSYIIENLAKMRAMELLKMIIQPLSHSNKEKMLLNNWQYGGINALDEFYHERDYDALRHYLLFFLIDFCPFTQNLSLRRDAIGFIYKFIDCRKFKNWIKYIPDLGELNNIIENLQGSLAVLRMVLEQVEENPPNCN